MPEERPEQVIGLGTLSTTIPRAALTFMLMGIMAPPAMYAVRLSSPTPTQLITAISISLFASVLYLWILDATAVFRFRSVWMSRSIYSIGIASIVTGSVGIYKDAFTEHLNPFDGIWRLSAWAGTGERIADNFEMVMYYSRSTKAYQGYSGFFATELGLPIRHIRVERFDPDTSTMIATVMRDKPESFQLSDGKIAKSLSVIEFSTDKVTTAGSVKFVFTRP